LLRKTRDFTDLETYGRLWCGIEGQISRHSLYQSGFDFLPSAQ